MRERKALPSSIIRNLVWCTAYCIHSISIDNTRYTAKVYEFPSCSLFSFPRIWESFIVSGFTICSNDEFIPYHLGYQKDPRKSLEKSQSEQASSYKQSNTGDVALHQLHQLTWEVLSVPWERLASPNALVLSVTGFCNLVRRACRPLSLA